MKRKIEDLEKEISQLDARIAEGEREQTYLTKRLQDAEERLTSLDDQAKEMRGRRQTALADGIGCEELTVKMDGMKHDRELIEDEITGLREKLAHFSAEPNLRVKKAELERLIVKGTLIAPIVDRYNRLARQMAKALTDLDQALLEVAKIPVPGRPLDSGTQDFFGGQMPPTLSLIGLVGDPLPALIFDRAALARKREAAAAVMSSQRVMEAQYKGCECFDGCPSYLGLSLSSPSPLPSCSKRNGTIPPGILTTKDKCEIRPDQRGQSHSASQKP